MSKLHNDNFSIHATINKNDKPQTDVVNSIKWKNHKVNIQ